MNVTFIVHGAIYYCPDKRNRICGDGKAFLYVGAYSWGFVAGKSQTHIAWDSWQKPYETEPELWFHDVLRPNGQPYCKKEVAYLVRFNKKHAS